MKLDDLIGKHVWLEYADHNSVFEQAFMPQSCEVLRRLAMVDGTDDWYLVRLDIPLDYIRSEYTHLLIRSRWEGHQIGGRDKTSVFIVLVPDPNDLQDPFILDRDLFIAWGMASAH